MAQQESTGEENTSLSQSPRAVGMSGPGKGSRGDKGVQEDSGRSCSTWSAAHGVILPNPPWLPFSEVTGSQRSQAYKALPPTLAHLTHSMFSAEQPCPGARAGGRGAELSAPGRFPQALGDPVAQPWTPSQGLSLQVRAPPLLPSPKALPCSGDNNCSRCPQRFPKCSSTGLM